MENKKENGSMAANIRGLQGPGGPLIKRKRMEEESFEDLVTYCEINELDLKETVKKVGNSWVVYDDKTKTQKGSFQKREDAWKRQEQLRDKKKADNKKNKKSQTAAKPHLARKPQTAPKAKTAPKPKKEHLMHMFRESLKRVLVVNEGSSALAYVFEQDPMPDDSGLWDAFLSKVSPQVVLADQKLRAVIEDMAKSEVRLLGNSVNEIKKVLEKTGNFTVNQKKPDQLENGDLFLPFEVILAENEKKLYFAVKVQNGKPLIQFPDQTKSELNMMSNDESKLLRAELLHVQETILDNMEDLFDATVKRNEYLRKTYNMLDKTIKSLDPLQIVMMRFLLKTKYGSIK